MPSASNIPQNSLNATPCPVVELSRLFPHDVRVLLSLETCGSTGNVKDRATCFFLESALQSGELSAAGTLIAACGGASGPALASAGARLGLRVQIVSPEGASPEYAEEVRRFGGSFLEAEGARDLSGALAYARRLADSISEAIAVDFGTHPSTSAAYETTSGPELWSRTSGEIDAFVAGVGSGAYFSGVARFLRSRRSSILRIAIEPESDAQDRVIPGLARTFRTNLIDPSLVSEFAQVSYEESVFWRDLLAQREGIPAGLSTGANLAVAARLAEQAEYAGKTILTVAFSRR